MVNVRLIIELIVPFLSINEINSLHLILNSSELQFAIQHYIRSNYTLRDTEMTQVKQFGELDRSLYSHIFERKIYEFNIKNSLLDARTKGQLLCSLKNPNRLRLREIFNRNYELLLIQNVRARAVVAENVFTPTTWCGGRFKVYREDNSVVVLDTLTDKNIARSNGSYFVILNAFDEMLAPYLDYCTTNVHHTTFKRRRVTV